MYEELFPSILITYNARLLHINLALFACTSVDTLPYKIKETDMANGNLI